MKSRTLILVGTVMYAVAWFLPVEEHSATLGSSVLPGWEAFRYAVWPYDIETSLPWYAGVHCVASALSNIVLVGGLALVLVARRRPPRLLQAILIASAVLNTHWFVLGQDRGDLSIGYYLWASSFFFIAAGFALEGRRAGTGRSPAV
jgi:hypothetical protein